MNNASTASGDWRVYLAGEIHSDWRDRIESGCRHADLQVTFSSPVTDHGASDACGTDILGDEDKPFWADHKSAKINAIRTRAHLKQADVVVIRFGEQYRQWNAAFDAGYAAALGTPLIVLHPEKHNHALKEIDAAALAVAETPEQVVEMLRYVISHT